MYCQRLVHQAATLTTTLLLFIALCLSVSVQARPSIGLALGGGGAKGAAHIGVLRVLEQHNIPIDYIAGTSIGSVVGGMVASGLSVDEIEKIMIETAWANGYSDRIPRENLPWRYKQQSDQFNIPLEVGVENDRLKMPSGVLYGQVATKLLRSAVGEHPNFDSFDDLVIPFRAIATDLANYKTVVLDSGSLITAMRASSGVPGALAPEIINGLMLVDGGITMNLPISVVREMGADIVIAVDIGSDLLPKEELQGTLAVMGQLSSFLTSSNALEQRKLLNDQDFLIKPDISGLSTTDWSYVGEAFNRGEIAANLQLSSLSRLSLPATCYQEHLSQRHKRRELLKQRMNKPVDRIELKNKSNLSDGLIIDRFALEPGNQLDANAINAAIDRLFSLNKFQRVDAYTVEDYNGEYKSEHKGENTSEESKIKVLHVIAEEKSWGPNFLQFGIGWEDDLDNQSDLNFNMALILGDLTKNGGELRSEFKMGTQRSFNTEFYWPFDRKQDFYSSSRYQVSSFQWNYYLDDAPQVPIDQQFQSVSQGLGYNYTQAGFMELGLTSDVGQFSDPILLAGEVNYFTYGGYLKFGYDTLNSINFPTQGSYFSFVALARNERVDDHVLINKQDNADEISSLVLDINWKGALRFGNHAVVAKASYAEALTDNNNESIYISYLGGFLNLSGYQKNALAGSKKVFVAGVYQFDLGKSLLNLDEFSLYLGLTLEAGNVWQQAEPIDQDLIVSNALYIGTDTSLGPIALGYGRTNQQDQAFYFYLGKSF